MSMQYLRQSPLLSDRERSDVGPKPMPELLVQYPKSDKVQVTLSEDSLWDDEPAIGNDRPWAANQVQHLPSNGDGAGFWNAPEPSSGAALLMAMSGLGIVAYLWSTVIL